MATDGTGRTAAGDKTEQQDIGGAMDKLRDETKRGLLREVNYSIVVY